MIGAVAVTEVPPWFWPTAITVLLAGAGGIVKAVAWVIRNEFAKFHEDQKALREDVADLRDDVNDQGRRLAAVEVRQGFVVAKGAGRA